MRKPRKPSNGKNKRRLDKKQLIMLPAAASVGFIVILIMNQATPKILEDFSLVINKHKHSCKP